MFEEFGRYVRLHNCEKVPLFPELYIMSAGDGVAKWIFSRKNLIPLKLVLRPKMLCVKIGWCSLVYRQPCCLGKLRVMIGPEHTCTAPEADTVSYHRLFLWVKEIFFPCEDGHILADHHSSPALTRNLDHHP